MSDDQTVWSKTLLDGFISGMKTTQSDEWIKEQARDLAERGLSVDYVYKLLMKDVDEAAANRFLAVTGATIKNVGKSEKKGLLGRLFS